MKCCLKFNSQFFLINQGISVIKKSIFVSRYGDTYEHVRIPQLQTRDNPRASCRDSGSGFSGCCSRSLSNNRVQFQDFEQQEDGEQHPSKVKNFFTWVSSKAG